MVISYGLVGALFGLLLGSAINAMVWRLYVGRSWAKGRSECPDCGHVLAPKDLVPVVSWVMLGGKCRYCRKPIKDHPVVELVTALAFGLSAMALMPQTAVDWVQFSFWAVMLVMLLVLATYDARWMLLPDKVMLPLIGVAFVYSAVMAGLTQAPQVLIGAVAAAVLAGGFFWVLVVGSNGRAMGGGDIKLAFAMGLMLGLQGTAIALLVAFNLAAAVGITLLITRRRGRRDQIPFGPYLVVGTFVAFLYARPIADWYLRLSGVV